MHSIWKSITHEVMLPERHWDVLLLELLEECEETVTVSKSAVLLGNVIGNDFLWIFLVFTKVFFFSFVFLEIDFAIRVWFKYCYCTTRLIA